MGFKAAVVIGLLCIHSFTDQEPTSNYNNIKTQAYSNFGENTSSSSWAEFWLSTRADTEFKKWPYEQCATISAKTMWTSKELKNSFLQGKNIRIKKDKGIQVIRNVRRRIAIHEANYNTKFPLFRCFCEISDFTDGLHGKPQDLTKLSSTYLETATNIPSSNICIGGKYIYISEGESGPSSFYLYAVLDPGEESIENLGSPELTPEDNIKHRPVFIVIGHYKVGW